MYATGEAAVTANAKPCPDHLALDGHWCPMAHCNRTDDSFQDLPPLRRVQSSIKITDPAVSPKGFIHLGSYTGRRMAVCAYSSPRRPALVAYDYSDQSVLWTSPMEDLQRLPRRAPSGILMATMRANGGAPRSYVFAGNPAEIVAYAADGTRVWKRSNNEIAAEAPQGVGMPVSLSFTDSRELVAATTFGWIIKLSPIDGRTIDAYRMWTSVAVDGKIYRGLFYTRKSPVVIGDVLYLLAEFWAHPSNPLPPATSPVHMIRIELTQKEKNGREHQIRPLCTPKNAREECPDRAIIGHEQGRGSPAAWVAPDGKVLIIGPAHTFVGGRAYPVIAGVEDDDGVLTRRWRTVLDVPRGHSVHSAPALHGPTGALFVTTQESIFLLRDVRSFSGDIPAPSRLPESHMVAYASEPGVAALAMGSPFALTFDKDTDEIVAYTNFRAKTAVAFRSYSFLSAFAVPLRRGRRPYPLWHRPLSLSPSGAPAPGPGTVGQPALFRYDSGKETATGLIVNTVFTGTYVLK